MKVAVVDAGRITKPGLNVGRWTTVECDDAAAIRSIWIIEECQTSVETAPGNDAYVAIRRKPDMTYATVV